MRLFLNSLFCLFICGASLFGAENSQENPSPCWQTETVKLVFDDSYTGNGQTLFVIQFRACMPDETVFDTFSVENYDGIEPVEGKFTVGVYNYVANYQNDLLFYFQVRVMSEGGKTTDWSNKCWVYKNWEPISPPEIELKKN